MSEKDQGPSTPDAPDDWQELFSELPDGVHAGIGDERAAKAKAKREAKAQAKADAARAAIEAKLAQPLLTAAQRRALSVRAMDAALIKLVDRLEDGDADQGGAAINELSRLLSVYSKTLAREDEQAAGREARSLDLVGDLEKQYAADDQAFGGAKPSEVDPRVVADGEADLDAPF